MVGSVSWRPARVVVGVAIAVALLVAGLIPAPAAGAADSEPFRGLGTWVDVYDYAPAFIADHGAPPVTPSSVADMARLGVRTLYLQVAQDDRRAKGPLVDRRLITRFVAAARRADVKVVAWYLPKLDDVAADLRRIRAMADYRADGRGFDGLALDIEWTDSVPDVELRNEHLVEISRRARAIAGATPLGAIVLEPVLLEVVNPDRWPAFPWRRLSDDYDAWLPMTYWTNRNASSGYREGFRYTDENIRRLRANLGKPNAAVHPIGGIADAVTPVDVEGFVRAARGEKAIGWSLYDYVTTSSSLWPRLRAGR